MSGDIKHIVNPADNPKITVRITPRTVASQITAFEFTPVLFSISLSVAVNRPQHRRPRFPYDQFPSDIGANLFAALVYHRGINAKERQRCAPRLGRNCAGQRSDQDRAGLGLPPGVDDGTTSAANGFGIPHPRFRIDRLTHRSKKSQGGEVVLFHPIVTPSNERPNRGGSGIKNGDAIIFNDSPKSIGLGPGRCALIH